MNSWEALIAFEHSCLFVEENGFTQGHFDALVKYNDLHGGKYFRVGHKKITFKSYVGIIQIGNLVIEVLPKADREQGANEEQKWRGVLLAMLANAGHIRLNLTDHANLHASRMKLLDIYLHTFLEETMQLVHAGLVKRYRRTKANGNVFKGRLLLDEQMQYNTVHKERFYTEHSVYDKNHVCNQILKTALQIIYDTSFNSHIRQESARLLLDFEGIALWQGNELDWEKITLDRKSLPYHHALELAKLIIVGYCPDFKIGKKDVIALLFDMNLLYERYIIRMLKNAEPMFPENKLTITGQHSSSFWANKTIRPDIVLTFCKTGDSNFYKIIIDTKWKIVDEGCPSDEDLKQLYVYNMQLAADHAILLYPSIGQSNRGRVSFASSLRGSFNHSCEMYFGQLFEEGTSYLNMNFAKNFLSYLISTK